MPRKFLRLKDDGSLFLSRRLFILLLLSISQSLNLIGEVFSVTKVENAVVDVHMCPIRTTTLCNAELAHYIKFVGCRIDKPHETTTLIIDKEFVVSSNDGALASTACPFLLVVGLTCFPIDAAPVTIVVIHPVGTINFAVDKHIASVVGVEGLSTPNTSHALHIIRQLQLEAVDVITMTEKYLAVLVES